MKSLLASNQITEFQYDLFQTVSAPMTSNDAFKQDILNALHKAFPSCGLEFFYAQNTLDKGLVFTDAASLNLSNIFYDINWQENYWDTCVYNPNNNPLFSMSDKSTFKIEDFMTLENHEKSRNYNDLMRPSGYYYSMNAFVKKDNAILGMITFLRAKSEGDFTLSEMLQVEAAIPYIANRTSDYLKHQSALSVQQLFSKLLDEESQGILVFDADFNLLLKNKSAFDMSQEMFCPSIFDSRFSDVKFQALIRGHLAPLIKNGIFDAMLPLNRRNYYFKTERFILADFKTPVYITRLSTSAESKAKNDFSTVLYNSLTAREKEIIQLVAKGMTYRQIADALVISPNTTRKHMENIHAKLNANNNVEVLKKLNLIT